MLNMWVKNQLLITCKKYNIIVTKYFNLEIEMKSDSFWYYYEYYKTK